MADYDAIVVGAGHNGLAAATVLAKQGVKVLAVEKNSFVGGMAATRELIKGFRFDIGGGILFPLSQQIVDDLELEKCGLDLVDAPVEARVTSCAIGAPGETPFISYSDASQMMKHLRDDHGEDVLQGLMGLREFCRVAAESIDRFNALSPPRSLSAIIDAAPTVQAKDMLRKAFFGSAMDLIDEFFPNADRHKVIRGQLAFAAVQSAGMGPYSPGTALCLIYTLASNGGGQRQWGRRNKGGTDREVEAEKERPSQAPGEHATSGGKDEDSGRSDSNTGGKTDE